MTLFGLIFLAIIFIILAVLITIEIHYESWFGSIIGGIFCSGIITLFVGLIFYGFSCIGAKYKLSNKFQVSYIEALSANSNIHGEFFLGSGQIQEKQYYFYIVKTKFGSKLCKMDCDDPLHEVYINEQEGKPYIRYNYYDCTYINWFGRLFFNKEFFGEHREIIINIPKKSIIRNFSVDVSKL